MPRKMDLLSLFSTVAGSLAQNQDSLNQADTYNHDHGDNMVETFRVITEAMETKKGADPADQLAYASQLLKNRSKSGSAKMYAEGLSEASNKFQGSELNNDNVMMLAQALLGGAQAPTPQSPASSGDPLGSLLGGMSSGQTSSGQEGLDMGNLINAGMAFMNAKQQGGGNLESIIQALVSSSQAGQTPHRAQSGALVTNVLMQLLGSMGSK